MRAIPLSLLGLLLLALPLPAQQAEAPKKVVIPFDFESKFDEGDYGKNMGDMFWAKLKRQGGFVIPETMQDIRDWSERTKTIPNPDTPMAKMKEIVTKDQGGDIGIWGKVERVPPNTEDVYDIWINVVDFSVDPPRVIYQKKARTQTVSEIPHIYVKEALDKLYSRPENVAEAGPDAKKEERWKTMPNLVKGGDFETGRLGPAGWDPLPSTVTWVREAGAKSPNRVLHYNLSRDVAENAGLFIYSDFFPVEEGATYRFQCHWRSTAPACKVFIKCYDELGTAFSNKSGQKLNTEKREVYRSQQNLTGPTNTWNTQTEDFTPKHTMYNPKWGRVMLYAYLSPGQVEWDDVVIKQIAPAPPDFVKNKDRRPSTETKVRLKDLQK